MQVTPRKIAAIKALANDERGDPNTRAVAKAKLEQMRREHPEMFAKIFHGQIPSNPPNPRMRKTDEFAHWRFMDMDQWKNSSKGNKTIVISTGMSSYRVTLFQHKHSLDWGWSRCEVGDSSVTYGKAFATIFEARKDAWESLTQI